MFLLAGSAITLAFAMLAAAAWSAALDPPTTTRIVVFVLVVVAAVTAVALPPQLRQVEGVMATGLLGADIGEPPSPARTWEETLGSAVWFWLHLVVGAVNGVSVLVLGAGGVLATLSPVALDPGTRIVGLSALTTTGTVQDVRLVLLGPVMVVLCGATALVSGHALRRLAPRLLGPSLESRLLRLRRTTDAATHRQVLARELHDSLGHSLSAIVIQSALARRGLTDGHPAVPSLADVERSARSALEELDVFLGRLRADEPDGGYLSAPDLDHLPHLMKVAEAAGHVVTTEIGPLLGLPPVVSQEAYRVVQESVTNAIRHAPGQPLDVEIRRLRQRLLLRVTNTLSAGPAAVAGQAAGVRSGRGLPGLRERVAALGGRADVSEEAGSWTVDVVLPLAGGAVPPARDATRGRGRRR